MNEFVLVLGAVIFVGLLLLGYWRSRTPDDKLKPMSTSAKPDKVEVYHKRKHLLSKRRKQKWRWRRLDGNNFENLSQSTEFYVNKSDCLEQADKCNARPYNLFIDEGDGMRFVELREAAKVTVTNISKAPRKAAKTAKAATPRKRTPPKK